MMLKRYGQAAWIAAILALTGNAVWAQQSCPGCCHLQKVCSDPSAAKTDDCCKEGKCCKDAESCCQNKKEGEASCCKSKTHAAKTCCGSCPFLSKLAKRTAIIMVMPASLPLPACCMETMGILPHPPLPPTPHVFLPPPMPCIAPMPSCGVNTNEATGNVFFDVGVHPNMALVGATPVSLPSITCSITKPTPATKICIVATSSSNQLEMSISEGTCLRCKKMAIQIGEGTIAVSHFGDRVRVRGEELKATADCVRIDGKDRLILEGDVVLHYKKDGRSVASVMKGDHIELNLSNGAMTIQRTTKTTVTPAAHLIEK
jgi:hypothetical protein